MSDALDWLNFFQGIANRNISNYDQSQTNDIIANKIKADPNFKVTPEMFASPQGYAAAQPGIELARKEVFGQQAAPTMATLQSFMQDPMFKDATSVQEIAKNPLEAVYGQKKVDDTWQDTTPTASGNPVLAKGLNDFITNYGTQSDLINAANDPASMARVSMIDKLAGNYQNMAQGNKQINDLSAAREKTGTDAALGKFTQGLSVIDSARAYGTPNQPGTFMPDLSATVNQFYNEFAKDPANRYALNDAAKLKDEYLKAQQAKEEGIPFKRVEGNISSGPTNENYAYDVDANGKPIATTKVSVTHTPPAPPQFDARKVAGDEHRLRKEFLSLPEVKEYPTVEVQTKRALKALESMGKGNNVAVDQSIITVFNKMLDPTSVVRESEYARTPGDLAALNRIKGKWDKISQGGAGLTNEDRIALNRMVNAFGVIASQQYETRANEYRDLADRYGYNPANVVVRGNSFRDADAPKTGASIAPSGTKAKLSDGSIVTSDGKGGWN